MGFSILNAKFSVHKLGSYSNYESVHDIVDFLSKFLNEYQY